MKRENMIRTRTELLTFLDSIGYDNPDYQIAVEALIFTPEGKILLQKRGKSARDAVGKLEGIGGTVEDGDDNLHERLQKEIGEELGAPIGGVEVDIERLLEIRQVQFEERVTKKLKDWVVVSHLCRITEGKPVIGEPDNTESLHELTLDELYAMDEADLSNSAIAARKTYREKYGNRPYYEVPEDTA
jgi:8-oxo-dGTP pyrophosphatase MutT (NUDIX family)